MADETTTTDIFDNRQTTSDAPRPTGTVDQYADLDNDDESGGGMINYYFVFLIFIFCIIAIVVFMSFRRRRRQRLYMLQNPHHQHHVGARGQAGGWATWERMQRPYWQERWHGAQASREEGLNEHGEAPPPYVPKRQSQEGQQGSGPTVPMQTLSRDNAGLNNKPPDYAQASVQDDDDYMRPAAGSSRTPEVR